MKAHLIATDEARRLETMDLKGLRAVWIERYGTPHPPLRSPELVRRILSWRIQAETMGGLDKPVLRILTGQAKPKPAGPVLHPGVRISREWRGRVCNVEVTADGFLYEGRTFDNLSEIAREITGTRWNGPRFFGLRKGAAR